MPIVHRLVILHLDEYGRATWLGGDEMTVRVLLVEDHLMLADSLTVVLTAEGLAVIRPPDLDHETVLRTAEAHEPHLVLLDLQLEAGGSSLPLIAPLTEQGACVVVVTAETDKRRLAECVEAGALGIVPKSEPFDHLVATVLEAAELRRVLTPAQRDELLDELRKQRVQDRARLAPFERLTPRERTVLAGMMAGKSNEDIAEESFVSVLTVRSQVRAVLQKLGVNSKLAAVAKANADRWNPETHAT